MIRLYNKFYTTGFFLLLVWIPLSALGQSDTIRADTVRIRMDSTSVYYFIGSIDSLIANRFHSIDTTLTYFHQYNPVQHGNRMYSTLDNIGLASYNRVFSPILTEGYIYMPPTFNRFLVSNYEVRYFKLRSPFTNLSYAMGPQKEQNLGVGFSRLVGKRLTLGIQLRLVNAPGVYYRSFSNDKNFYLTAQYYTKDKRYGIIANYLYNKDKVQENGGLLYDSIFEQHLETDPKVIPVRLKTAQNMVKTSGFFVEQYFNLQKPDSNKTQSKRQIDAGNISYTFQYQKNKMVYSDLSSDSLFYMAFPAVFDTLSSYDSIYQVRVRNSIRWSNQGYNEGKLSQVFHLSFGLNFDHIEQSMAYDSTLSKINELSPFGGLSLWLFKRSYLNARAQFTVGGYNNGDFEIEAGLMQYLGSQEKNIGKLRLNLHIVNRMPAWYFSHYKSNRFNWDQTLKKERFLILKGEYLYKRFLVGAKLQTLNNYTFFNDSVKPAQNLQTGTVLQLYSEGTLPIHKFGINFRGVYQTTSMGNSIHLPLFTGMLDLYFKGWIFHHAGKLQTGFQLSYFTSYYADAYMPELRSFYLQSQKKIGDYLMVTAYASLKVKTFRIFVKETNLRGYLGKFNYYSTPHYPAIGPGLYLGVSWRFHN